MPTPLQDLIKKIETLPDEIEHLVDQGINSFNMPKTNVINDWNIFQYWLGKFYCDIEFTILGIRMAEEIDIDFYAKKSFTTLEKKFGTSSMQASFEIARTGNEGGMYTLMKTLAKLIGEKYLSNQIGTLINIYMEKLSPDDIIADSKEYLATYSHLLPLEISEKQGIRVQANFFKVLNKHPYMMRDLKRKTR